MATPTFSFESAAYAQHPFRVVDFQGTEQLNAVYRFEIRLKVDEAESVDLKDLLSNPASLILQHDKAKYCFHGLLASAEREQTAGGYHFFR
ncbi:MAG TPA: type VI secretion system tip protein VgrG, partial [Gammaproteobacteria bacterium]|nr:type VI secretion system tip protein VgrG [Gammaproteobacteria bacterium]